MATIRFREVVAHKLESKALSTDSAEKNFRGVTDLESTLVFDALSTKPVDVTCAGPDPDDQSALIRAADQSTHCR